MKNKLIRLLPYALVLTAASVSSLDGYYTLKPIIYSLAATGLIVIGFYNLYAHKKNRS